MMTKRMKKGEKKTRAYVVYQNLPQSSKRHKVSVISGNDETSVATRPYGISDNKQPDDMVSIPDQHTIKQQIKDLYGEGDNDDLDPILTP